MPLIRFPKTKAGVENSTANTTISDVVGNKADTAATTVGVVGSIMAYIKGLMGFHIVPTANSAANINLRDVIGNKTDKSFSNAASTPSIIGHLIAAYYHVHDSAKVWPTGVGANATKGADPITIASNNGTAWLHGTKVEVVPAATITTWFDIHWLVIGNAAEADDYEMRIYKGALAAEVEIGRVAFSRAAIQDRATVYIPVQIPPQQPNTRISASLACSDGDGAACALKFYYHAYPDIT